MMKIFNKFIFKENYDLHQVLHKNDGLCQKHRCVSLQLILHNIFRFIAKFYLLKVKNDRHLAIVQSE